MLSLTLDDLWLNNEGEIRFGETDSKVHKMLMISNLVRHLTLHRPYSRLMHDTQGLWLRQFISPWK